MAGYIIYQDGLPACEQSSIQVVTGLSVDYVDLNQRANHYTTPPPIVINDDDSQFGLTHGKILNEKNKELK